MPPKAPAIKSRSGLPSLALVVVVFVLTSFVALLYSPVKLRLDVLGVTRRLSSIKNIHGHELKRIPGTRMCEDIHLHRGSSQSVIIAACEGEGNDGRWGWFPG